MKTKRLTTFALLLVTALVLSACGFYQPAPDVTATYQSAVKTAVATIYVGKTLEAAAVTQTPRIVVQTVVVTVIPTSTPAPTATPTVLPYYDWYPLVYCDNPDVLEFLIDNKSALNPPDEGPNYQFSWLYHQGRSHFNFNRAGTELKSINSEGLGILADRMGALAGNVENLWAPRPLRWFRDLEANYLRSLEDAFRHGAHDKMGEALESLKAADWYRMQLDDNVANWCPYRVWDP